MNQPTYRWARLQDLTGPQVHEMLQARELVFVVEQNCPYLDADDADLHAWHLMGHLDGKLACYARIVPPGKKFPEPSIGRVLTTAGFRGKGLGRPMMLEAVRQTQQLYSGQDICLSAQAHLQQFYGDLGFEPQGDIYQEDGIPHMLMRRRFSNAALTSDCLSKR